MNSPPTPQEIVHQPHRHDVLCGRGGGINSHPGNQTFRNWVREKKEAYNLAANKIEKAKVSRDVLDQVANLDPPGRFLQREELPGESGPVWVEIDDMKAMAKTSQALREGAPAIRAKAKCEPLRRKSTKKSQAKRKLPDKGNDGKNNMKNVISEVQPRSKSITRMIAANMAENAHSRKRKLLPEYDATVNDPGDRNKSGAFTCEKEEHKKELTHYVSMVFDNVPPSTDIESETKKTLEKNTKTNQDVCIVTDTLKLVESTLTNSAGSINTDEQSTTLTHCSSEFPTPTLLPTPAEAPIDPPALHLFPLPPVTFPMIPLSPTIHKEQAKVREPFPPLISPNNDTEMTRSNNTINELLDGNECVPETLSLRGSKDMDVSFADPFSSENERFDRVIEGHPDFSATGLSMSRWNMGLFSGGCPNRNFTRSSSTSSIRSITTELSDLPECAEKNTYESSDWNMGMNDVLFARDLGYKSDVTYLIPLPPDRGVVNVLGRKKRKKKKRIVPKNLE